MIQIKLTDASIKQAIKDIRDYKLWVEQKEIELRKRLAKAGASVAKIRFLGATYDSKNGKYDVNVKIDTSGPTAIITASGRDVAFIEFGAGAKFGYGHPMADQFGVGPGTYPDGKGHWDNPDGWYYKHGTKSYGNPPAQAMVAARDAIVEDLTRIAREVFGHA